MKAPFTLGPVGHFSLLVSDVRASATWYRDMLGLEIMFEFDGGNGVALTNDDVTIVLHAGKPYANAFGHMSFRLPDMTTLRAALAYLKEHGVEIEDPGDEIGPEAEGSPNLAFWIHDPDGYRFELSVQGGATEAAS